MTGEAQGFVLGARGAAYVDTAFAAGQTMRAAMPSAAIDLFTDAGGLSEAGPFSEVHELPRTGRNPKFAALLGSRFDRTIYVDADIRCLADMSDIFTVLDRFDIAMVHDPFRNSKHARGVWQTALPNAFPHLNGGLIAFRQTEATLAFLTDVEATMIRDGIHTDQAIIREKLYASDLRLCVLPSEYNLMDYRQAEMWGSLHAAPRMIHHSKFRKSTGSRLTDVRSLRGLVGPDMVRHFDRLIAADHALTPGNAKKVRPLAETGLFGVLRQGTRSLRKGIVRLLRL